MIIGIYNLAGAVTFLGLVLALAAAIFSYQQHLSWAMVCLINSGICDLFDGWVARRLNRSEAEKSFGLHIDSLVDMVAFGFVPLIILLHSGFNSLFDYFLFACYVSAAAMRLAYFNLTQANSQQVMKTFTGLPVTYAALVFPCLFLLSDYLSPMIFQWIARSTVVIMALMFVLRVPIPKPRGVAYIVLVLLAIAMTTAWIVKT
jgi:CDP-diacylglycerol--serine O-phosphatidyltransferase